MADFTIIGAVTGNGSEAGVSVRGAVRAAVFSTGALSGAGAVAGYVVPSIVGAVTGVGFLNARPVVAGEAAGVGVLGAAGLGAAVLLGGAVVGTGALGGGARHAISGAVTGVGVLTEGPPEVGGAVVGGGALGGVVSAARSLTGGVSGVGVLTGGPRPVFAFNTLVTGAGVLGGALRLAVRMSGAVFGVGELGGALVNQRSAAADSEQGYEQTGVRPGFTLLVHAVGALTAADVAAVPDNGSFLVGASFAGGPGDPFYDSGAGASSIGTRVKPVTGPAYLVFRSPVADEVVWHVGDEQLYRFRPSNDGGQATWRLYVSLPERTLEGQYILSVFDPDGIYKYYARLWGSMYARWSYDNHVLLDQTDPARVSRHYIGALASQFGLVLPADDALAVKRAKTQSAVAAFKLKGTPQAVVLRLRALGFKGYANEVWVAPEAVGNFQSAVLNIAGLPSSSPTGAGNTHREYPHGYRRDEPADGYVPSSRVAVHINDNAGNPVAITSAIKQQVAAELRRDVLPVHVDIRYFVTDVNVLGGTSTERLSVGDSLVVTEV